MLTLNDLPLDDNVLRFNTGGVRKDMTWVHWVHYLLINQYMTQLEIKTTGEAGIIL